MVLFLPPGSDKLVHTLHGVHDASVGLLPQLVDRKYYCECYIHMSNAAERAAIGDAGAEPDLFSDARLKTKKRGPKPDAALISRANMAQAIAGRPPRAQTREGRDIWAPPEKKMATEESPKDTAKEYSAVLSAALAAAGISNPHALRALDEQQQQEQQQQEQQQPPPQPQPPPPPQPPQPQQQPQIASDAEGPFEIVLPPPPCADGSCALAASRGQPQLTYRPLHRSLFGSAFRPEWLADSFAAALADGSEQAFRAVLREEVPGRVFSFEMLKLDFCDRLLEEIMHYESSGLPVTRPNSMNNCADAAAAVGSNSESPPFSRDT